MQQPRAADDFAAIRARMEELQRERAQITARDEPTLMNTQLAPGGRRSHDKPRLLSQILRAMVRAETR